MIYPSKQEKDTNTKESRSAFHIAANWLASRAADSARSERYRSLDGQ